MTSDPGPGPEPPCDSLAGLSHFERGRLPTPAAPFSCPGLLVWSWEPRPSDCVSSWVNVFLVVPVWGQPQQPQGTERVLEGGNVAPGEKQPWRKNVGSGSGPAQLCPRRLSLHGGSARKRTVGSLCCTESFPTSYLSPGNLAKRAGSFSQVSRQRDGVPSPRFPFTRGGSGFRPVLRDVSEPAHTLAHTGTPSPLRGRPHPLTPSLVEGPGMLHPHIVEQETTPAGQGEPSRSQGKPVHQRGSVPHASRCSVSAPAQSWGHIPGAHAWRRPVDTIFGFLPACHTQPATL